jgi:hypothetical protein
MAGPFFLGGTRVVLQSAAELAVVGVFLDPVEASADEEEFVTVLKAELDVGFVSVDIAVEDELVGGRAGEGEVEFGVGGAAVGEGEGVLLCVDGGGAERGRVHVLEFHGLVIEENAVPAVVIGEEWGTELAVGGELLYIPDAVERWLGCAGAVLFPADACTPDVGCDEPDCEDSLRGESDVIGAGRAEERRFGRGLGGAIEEEEIEEAAEIGREKEERHEDELEGEQLDGHVVGHVEEEDIGHVGKRDEGTEGAIS